MTDQCFNKTRIVELAQKLHELGYELLTGGTKRTLEAAGLPVTGISG